MKVFCCAVFLASPVLWLRRFCCWGGWAGGWYRKLTALTATKKWGAGAPLVSAQGSQGLGGGMVSHGRCAHRNGAQGSQGLGGWQFWGDGRLLEVFCCAVFFGCACFWLRRFCCSGGQFWGMVSHGRYANRNGAQGSQGLGGGLFWGDGRLMKVFCCAVFGCAVFLASPVFRLRRFCCWGGSSGGMVSQGRCAIRHGAQGSQGLGGGGSFGGMVGQIRCAHRYREMGCRGHAWKCYGTRRLCG